MGRPRTTTPPDHELEALGEEMIAWVIEKSPIHLTQWWRLQKHFTSEVWRNIIDHPNFSPYYEEALNIIALQYLTKDSQIEPSLKHRWQRLYFKDLKDQEDRDADDEIARKVKAMKDTAQSFSEEDKAKFDAIMAQLNSLQSDSKRSKKDSMS